LSATLRVEPRQDARGSLNCRETMIELQRAQAAELLPAASTARTAVVRLRHGVAMPCLYFGYFAVYQVHSPVALGELHRRMRQEIGILAIHRGHQRTHA